MRKRSRLFKTERICDPGEELPCKQGEIDIIAKDGKYFVFIEVKFRASGSAGFSLEAIDHRKTMRIRNAAVYYLFSHHLPEETPCRFDAAGIDGEEITYIRNAF